LDGSRFFRQSFLYPLFYVPEGSPLAGSVGHRSPKILKTCCTRLSVERLAGEREVASGLSSGYSEYHRARYSLAKEAGLGRSELERLLDKGDVAKDLGVEFAELNPERVVVTMPIDRRHLHHAPHESKRPHSFVETLDLVTPVGHHYGGDSPTEPGCPGPTTVIPNRGVLRPDPETKESTLVALHPGATVEGAREVTGWELRARTAAARGESS
jgi:hypothetical protein